MTTCKTIQPRLTAYLDGELDGELGSVVRGHLRECADCRVAARDEATLRDGLRALQPVDPPSALWAGVQARLAAAEVADARTPSWRRVLARWTPALPRFATGGLVAAAAVAVLYWRAHPTDGAALEPSDPVATQLAVASSAPANSHDAQDVTADLAAEPARTTASYGEAIEELMTVTNDARPAWSDDQRAAFDARVVELRAAIAQAEQGRPQQRAQRALIRYLQTTAVGDDILLASGGGR